MLRNDADDAARRYPLRMPPGWDPPVPAWSSTFGDSVSEVAMCVIGFEHDPGRDVAGLPAGLRGLAAGADIADFATCEGAGGRRQTAAILYWCDPRNCADWLNGESCRAFWAAHAAGGRNYGAFREVFNIPLERSETLFSGPEHDHGMSRARSGVEGPVRRHMYWGGVRDRIPRSADDALDAGGPLQVVEDDGRCIRIQAHENLCVIRSGQDWSLTEGEQRREYLEEMEPVLKTGMDFLRDEGRGIGCYSCRYMREIAADGTPAERTFGLAYFRTLAELENWAEHHPTHLAIFNTFLGIAPKYGADLQLRLWHEVSVLPAGNQFGEYVDCSPGTGLLGGLADG